MMSKQSYYTAKQQVTLIRKHCDVNKLQIDYNHYHCIQYHHKHCLNDTSTIFVTTQEEKRLKNLIHYIKHTVMPIDVYNRMKRHIMFNQIPMHHHPIVCLVVLNMTVTIVINLCFRCHLKAIMIVRCLHHKIQKHQHHNNQHNQTLQTHNLFKCLSVTTANVNKACIC